MAHHDGVGPLDAGIRQRQLSGFGDEAWKTAAPPEARHAGLGDPDVGYAVIVWRVYGGKVNVLWRQRRPSRLTTTSVPRRPSDFAPELVQSKHGGEAYPRGSSPASRATADNRALLRR